MPGPLSPQGRQRALLILTAAVLLMGVGVALRTARVVREVGRGGTYERVRAILVRRLGVDAGRITPGAALTAELLPDEAARTELVTAVEEEFEIDLPEGEAAAIRTMQDMVVAVERRLAARRRE